VKTKKAKKTILCGMRRRENMFFSENEWKLPPLAESEEEQDPMTIQDYTGTNQEYSGSSQLFRSGTIGIRPWWRVILFFANLIIFGECCYQF
jgi:hypothetical protein